MTMHRFRTRCTPGVGVCLSRDTSRRGIIKRISADRSRALVAWQGGDITWTIYYALELLTPKENG